MIEVFIPSDWDRFALMHWLADHPELCQGGIRLENGATIWVADLYAGIWAAEMAA